MITKPYTHRLGRYSGPFELSIACMVFLCEKYMLNKDSKKENKVIFGGAVYCKETGNGIKIGSSSQPNIRLKSHNNTYGDGNSYVSLCYNNYINIELHVHEKLKEKRLHGEHFDISFNDAVFAINESCLEIGVIANKFIDKINSKISHENSVRLIQYIDEKTKDKNINDTCTILEWCILNNVNILNFESFTEIEKYIKSVCDELSIGCHLKDIDGLKCNLFPIYILNNILPLILTGISIQINCSN